MCLAVPGKIEHFVADDPEAMKMAKVDFGGIKKVINLDLVPEADVGDFVLVHVGIAISKVDEEEAQRTLNFLEGMGELDDLKIDEILLKERKSGGL
ncbi:HypC/HybG/HupF family hydrogenase formation chaperone [Cyclobacteriaceae bacterium]|nr:HypC/HybG/HupF family hydrogenase formation chaperone [Cyclobacteriaceae bacterium]MDA8889786.1 HypC/HybG/HupF family hydrogenase formation chaperone [Cyclobacteriaceae bacterium]